VTAPTDADVVPVTVNGVEVEANAGELLIDACERNGVYIPRFCHHPRMKPVGMCRMCLVEVDAGRGASLQPSCMLPCTPGMIVDTESDLTKKAQDGVLEFLLINHPLDCPVCDKGGECPLQDQTMAYGPGESRFVEEKRHYEKPIPISDTVYLDRERCILCDRCTRFASEVAGDPLIHFQDRGSQTQVNTFPDEPFASYFSGNTVQICPVGALTAKPYRFKARPWDLEEVDSTFPNPMGDRVNVQSSRDRVLRIQGVDSDATNWGWLTDRDRFSFEALSHDQRLVTPLVRGDSLGNATDDGDELVATSWAVAVERAASAITASLEAGGAESIGVIGGANLTTEAQYVWAKLAKGVIGTDNVDAQLGDGLPAQVVTALPRNTISDAMAPGSAVVLLVDDPKEQFGTLFLRLRHAAVEGDITIVELSPIASGLGSLVTVGAHARPGDVGAVARAIVDGRTDVEVGGVEPAELQAAAAALAARAVTVIVGRPSVAEQAGPIIDAIAAFTELESVSFLPLLRRGNISGALDMGLTPGMLPGRTTLAEGGEWYRAAWGTVPADSGLDTAGMLEAAVDGSLTTLVLLGADPLADFPDADLASRGLAACRTVIAVDIFASSSVANADVVLPAAGFAEGAGTHTNLEGRLSPLMQKVNPPGTARADWLIAAELAWALRADLGIESPESAWAEIERLAPSHAGATVEQVRAAHDGLVIPRPDDAGADRPAMVSFSAPVPTEIVPVDGYALRLVADRRLYDQGTIVQHCASMAHQSDLARISMHPLDAAALGVRDGDLVRVTSARASIELPARPDRCVPRGRAVIPLNRAGADVRALIDLATVVTDVRVATL